MKTPDQGGYDENFAYLHEMPPVLGKVATETLTLLDMTMAADIPWPVQQFNYRDGITHRSFTYLGDRPTIQGGEAIEDTLTMYHQKLPGKGESYGIRSSWKVAGSAPDQRFETGYLLESYPQGPFYATIWQREPVVSLTGELAMLSVVPRQMHQGDFISLNEDFRRLFAAVQSSVGELPDRSA